MKTLYVLSALVLVASPVFGQETGPLDIIVPSGWVMQHGMKVGGDYSYSFNNADPAADKVFTLTLQRFSADLPPDSMGNLVDSLGENFANLAKKDPDLSAKIDLDSKTRGSLHSGPFSMQSVTFKMKEGDGTQALFIFHDGDVFWTGDFTGTAQQWQQTLGLFKTMKKAKAALPKPSE